MRLTKEQQQYLDRKINEIYQNKTKGMNTICLSGLYLKESAAYPNKVNKAIAMLKEYEKEHNKKVNEARLPFTEEKSILKEKILFSNNFEEVQALLKSFQSFTGQ